MASFFCKQVQNSEKITETKSLGCGKMFVGCTDGYALELSMIKNKTVHEQKILNK